MCTKCRTLVYFGLPWGCQAGRLGPGFENPILEAGLNYYISLYAPFTTWTHLYMLLLQLGHISAPAAMGPLWEGLATLRLEPGPGPVPPVPELVA